MSTRHIKAGYRFALGFSLVLLGAVACGSDEVGAEDQDGNSNETGGSNANPSNTLQGGASAVASQSGPAVATGGFALGRGGSSASSVANTNRFLLGGAAGTGVFASGGRMVIATGGAMSVAGASSAGVTCASGKACTTSCTAKCLNDASASYTCQCSGGKLDCDTRACMQQQVNSCEDGAACTKDCVSACPGDASTQYTCSCSGGQLTCDVLSCLGGDVACPATNSDGLACSGDLLSTCTPPAGSTETMCFCLQESWMCI